MGNNIIDLSPASQKVFRLLSPYPELSGLYVQAAHIQLFHEPIAIPDGSGRAACIGATTKIVIEEAYRLIDRVENRIERFEKLQIVGGCAYYETSTPTWWAKRKESSVKQ